MIKNQISLRMRAEQNPKFDLYRFSNPLIIRENTSQPFQSSRRRIKLPPLNNLSQSSLILKQQSSALVKQNENSPKSKPKYRRKIKQKTRLLGQSIQLLNENIENLKVPHNFANTKRNRRKRLMGKILANVMGSGIDPWQQSRQKQILGLKRRSIERFDEPISQQDEGLRSYCLALKMI